MSHGVVLVVVGHDRQHRAEDLLLGDRHVRRDVGEDRRLHEEALVEALGGVGAAGEQRGALLIALVDVAPHPLALDGGHERAEAAGLLERVAGGVRLGGGRGDGLHLGQAAARHQHAGERGAGLAGVEEALAHAVGDGLLQVGVVEDDVGGLAAELQRHPLHGLRGHLGDPLAGAGRAGERHHVDVGVGGDGLTDDRAEPGDEVEHAGGQPDLVDDLGQDERVDRRHLAGLEHDGVAGGERRRHLQGDLVQRVVPRRDAADDADGLAHDEAVADGLLEGEASARPGRRCRSWPWAGRPG